MEICGRGETKVPLEEDLAGGGIEQIGATNDVVYPLQKIVDDDGQLVGPDAIGSTEYEVAAVGFEIGRDLALETVREDDGLRGDE